MAETVLGFLASRFASHPETIATQGLGYLLTSHTAAAALSRLLAPVAEVDERLRYRTEVSGGEGERPDLIGYSGAQSAELVIEAKFWAELTPNQPVTYLRGTAGVAPKVLLFVAPRQRFETLWSELRRRCLHSSLDWRDSPQRTELWSATIADRSTLALCSWGHVLQIIRQELEASGDHSRASDARQLEGLAAVMDEQASMPFDAAFLSNEQLPGRLLQLQRLVKDVITRCVAGDLISVAGLRAVGTSDWVGQYLKMDWMCGRLGVDLALWSRYGTTPLWLVFQGSDWKGDGLSLAEPIHALPLLSDEPLRRTGGGHLAIPIFVPSGLEVAGVVAGVVDQLQGIHAIVHLHRPSWLEARTVQLPDDVSTARPIADTDAMLSQGDPLLDTPER